MASSRLDDFDPIGEQDIYKAPPDGGMRPFVANIIRYGVPTAVALKSPTAAVPAAAASEWLAREIEQFEDLSSVSTKSAYDPAHSSIPDAASSYNYDNPDFQEAKRHLSNAAWGAGAGFAELGAMKVLAPIMTKIGKLGLQPLTLLKLNNAKLPLEVQRAIDVTGQLTGENLTSGAGGVITPTLGQITRHERGLWAWLDATARSAIGPSRQMQKFTDKMISAVHGKLTDFLSTAATQMDSAEFGAFQRRLLTGEMDTVKSVRNWLYNGFRTQAASESTTANLSATRQLFADAEANKAINKDRMLNSVWNNMKDKLREAGLDVDNPAGWNSVPADIAERLRARANEMLEGNLMPNELRTARQLQTTIKDALDAATSGRASGEWLAAADSFGGKSAERLEKGLMGDVFKHLTEKPADVVNLINTPKKYDALLAVKNAYTNADTSMLSALRARGINVPSGTTLNQTLYEESILKPLRHSFISQAVDPTTGLIKGKALARIIDTATKKDGGAYLGEVFSTQGRPYLESIKDFAYTLKVLEEKHVGEKVFISLIQGGQIVSAGMGAVAALQGGNQPGGGDFGGWFKRTAIGMNVVFLTPFALSAMLTRPTLTRTVLDGLVRGPRTTAFTRAIATIGALNERSKEEMAKLPARALDFYSNMASQGMIQPTAEQYPPPGQPPGM